LGNLFIADSFNYKIRLVSSNTEIITTFAGTGNPSPFAAGDFGDGGQVGLFFSTV
jgi:hypothetical protein